MEFNHFAAAGALMKAVHILGDETELRKPTFHIRERNMRRIGIGVGNEFAPPGIPFPHKTGIALERARCGKFLRTIIRPETSLRIAKRRHTAFRRYAGSCQNRHAFRDGKAMDQLWRDIHSGKMDVSSESTQARTNKPDAGISVERDTPVIQTGIEGALPSCPSMLQSVA